MAGWTGTFGRLSSFDVLFFSSVSSSGSAITKGAELQKGGFCGAIETSAVTPLLCRPWTKSPSILKWTNEKVCRQSIRPRSTQQWLNYVETHLQRDGPNVEVDPYPTHLWAEFPPAIGEPLCFSTIGDKTSKQRQHSASVKGGCTWCQQPNDQEQHMATDCLRYGYKYKVSIQSFKSVVFHEIQWKPSNFRSFCSILAWVTSPVALVVLLHAANLQRQP